MKGAVLVHHHSSKPHRLARRKGGIEAVEDPHLVGAVALAVEIERHGRAVASSKLAAPAGVGLQGRGYNLSGHEGARVKQQA